MFYYRLSSLFISNNKLNKFKQTCTEILLLTLIIPTHSNHINPEEILSLKLPPNSINHVLPCTQSALQSHNSNSIPSKELHLHHLT